MKTMKKQDLKPALYARKSTESEDRQVLSIPAQMDSAYKIADKNNISSSELAIYSESKSARKPGRAEFDRMLKDIDSGKIDTIICWDIDRLARNPKDGGEIIWGLIRGKIKQIITPTEVFYPYSNMLLLHVKFGMSTQYSLDLSKNVKRGNRTKLIDKGWWTAVAPYGYLNNPDRSKWESEPIIPDPERFDLVKQLWNLLMSGNYSVPQIVTIANEELGLRTVKRKKIGGNKLTKTSLHRVFNNPFYYGYMIRGELEGWGNHKPMITQDEFEKAQQVMKRSGGTRFRKREFPFKGVMSCGECGCQVTAEDTTNRHGKTYTYYHCTKKRNTPEFKCSQKSIRQEVLEEQIVEALRSFKVPEDFKEWGKVYLRLHHQRQSKERKQILAGHEKNYNEIDTKLDKLTDMKLRDLIDDDEFMNQKNRLIGERKKVKEHLEAVEKKGDDWRDLAERAFDFLNQAEEEYIKGDYITRNKILNALGTEFVLKDKTIQIKFLDIFEYFRGKPKRHL